ncbi:uncharacterized protein LTR77_006547 [Saxophila tyrrhenica]|uniref:Catalase core domain-containing protein n=1 Tax=Saxophila tyrrhenica TaxID=1690608 RepID=A0AAV9P832_9PEZI|nr:hypothetical protein LTR77_006547 [Saxophila tyrrhenica]
MPLSSDQSVNETAGTLVKTLQGAFGTPAGYRPAHAKGRLTKGTFTPSQEAATLSTAPHFNNASTPILTRFSNSTGLHAIPDTDPNANPRGMAVRFLLSSDGHKHTDIIAHSTSHFPMRTGEGFLQMLGAIGGGTIGEFLAQNPSAKAFVEDPKPAPESFGTERYFGVTAFKLIDREGKETFVRYRIVPEAGYETLSEEELKGKGKDYLFEELEARLKSGLVSFKLMAQVAEEDDVTDDNTVHWPEERKQVELGTIEVEEMVGEKESKEEQQRIIFDPIPRVEGVDVSADPLLDMRAAIYLISGKERRAAASTA